MEFDEINVSPYVDDIITEIFTPIWSGYIVLITE